MPDGAKTHIDPVFEGNIAALQSEEAIFTPQGGAPEDMTDWETLGEPFDRSTIQEKYLEGVGKQTDSAPVGGLISLQHQNDWLACLERAYRNVHAMTPARARAHADQRRAGLQRPRGAFARVLEQARRFAELGEGK